MFHRIQAALPPALPRTHAGFVRSTSRSSVSGLALVCLLMAGCAGGSPRLTSDGTSLPKVDPAEAEAAAAGPGGASASSVSQDPVLLKRRKDFDDPALRQHYRRVIAQLLEENQAYRTAFEDGAVKLFDAKISQAFITLTRDR